MQGQRSSIGALPENVFFDNGSLPAEPIVTAQIPWSNSNGTSQQSWVGPALPLNPNNFQYMQQPLQLHGQQIPGFTFNGQPGSSSAQHQVGHHSVRTPQDSWDFRPQSLFPFGSQQLLHSSNTLSLDNTYSNVELYSNSNSSQTTRGSILPNPVSNALPLDLNASVGSLENNGYYQDPQQAYTGASNDLNPLSSTSSEFLQASRKRKALALSEGQSSGEGSSSQWHWNPSLSDNRNITLPPQRGVVIGNGPVWANSGLGIIPSSPLPLTTSVNAESSRVNPHFSVGGFPQQSLLQPNSLYPNVGNVNPSFSGSLGPVRGNLVPEVNQAPVVENLRLLGHTLSIPRPPAPSRPTWNPSMLEGSAARNIPGNPVIVPPVAEIRSADQNPSNSNWVGRNAAAAAASTRNVRARLVQGTNVSETVQPQSTPPQYVQRLSEIARRSLFPSPGTESGGQGNANPARSSSSGASNLARQARAALLARRLSSANISPENFRRVIEIMRRGEALRYEDAMLLEQSFLAMADMQDRHRDMRMDVDNMSYEELLALEERIGNVCTGLSEEAIKKHMKQRVYVDGEARDGNEIEPCSICREEYNEGEDLGTLECGHDFHGDCIKQWLLQKNLCPICKNRGLNI